MSLTVVFFFLPLFNRLIFFLLFWAKHYFLKNFGGAFIKKKKKPTEGFTMQELADDAIELAKHVFPGRKIHILGISMGGMIVQTMVCFFMH